MEKITTYNYEAFYLDFLEGNLGDIETAMLFDFLNAHPNLKTELEMDDDVMDFTLKQTDESLHRFDKEDLKYFDCKANEICLNNVADFMVADVEGEISADKKIELDTFIKEHDLVEDINYFNATKLQADLTEVFPNKKALKHKGVVIPLWSKIASAAAIGLLLFNFLGNTNSATETYSPRQGNFALQIENSILPFEWDKNDNNQQNNLVAERNNDTYSDFVENEQTQSNAKDSVIEPIIDLDPNTNLVKKDNIKPNETIKNTPVETPIKNEPKADELATVENDDSHAETNANNIKLVDMYKPVTDLTNNYTNLNVSYKKSVPESEYQVTTFSIGKFSFERKRKK